MESANGHVGPAQPPLKRRRGPDPRVAAAVALLLGSLAVVAWRVGAFGPARTPRPAGSVLSRDDPAPEFQGLSRWFNSPPLSMKGLRGKVVLIDFWTYSCINCVRTFPEIRALHQAYGPLGLVVVGIHSPEFGFEKTPSNVEAATVEKKVVWPVAMDNDMKTWRAFRNHYWPHVYLVDHRGRIRFDHIGEGGGAQIEGAVRALLRGRDPRAALPPPVNPHAEGPSEGITPEIYLGYERGEALLGNPEGFGKDRVVDYVLPGDASPGEGGGLFYLDGRWRAGREGLVAAEAGARVVVPFTARDVFVVGGASTPTRIQVLLDGRPYSFVTLGMRDLVHLVRLPRVESHDLILRATAPGAELFTFTFG